MTRVLAKALDPEKTTVREIMTPNPVCVPPQTRVSDAVLIMIEKGLPPSSHRRAGIEDRRRFLGPRCIAARDRHRAQPDRVQRADERRARVGGRAWPWLGPVRLRSRRACVPPPRLRPHACGPAGRPAWRGPSLPAVPDALRPAARAVRCVRYSAPAPRSACACDQACQPVRFAGDVLQRDAIDGQTGTHSSQPVQYGSMTVCISLLLPRMASVGQASRQSVQPMHQPSSMTATARGPSDAVGGIQRQRGAAGQRGQARDAFGAAGRALIDFGLAVGDGLRVSRRSQA